MGVDPYKAHRFGLMLDKDLVGGVIFPNSTREAGGYNKWNHNPNKPKKRVVSVFSEGGGGGV